MNLCLSKKLSLFIVIVSLCGVTLSPLGREAFCQAIPGQKAPGQGGQQGNNPPQVAGQKDPNQGTNQGKNTSQVPDQKASTTASSDGHPHTVAKPPIGPVQQGPVWDEKMMDLSKLPPGFDPAMYKNLQQGMFLKAETKSVAGKKYGGFPISIGQTPHTPSPTPKAPCDRDKEIVNGYPTFLNSAVSFELGQMNWKLKEQEQEQLKIFTDSARPQAERDQAYKELQSLLNKMKANLMSLLQPQVLDKLASGTGPGLGQGYYGKTYPAMKGHEAGALILLGLGK